MARHHLGYDHYAFTTIRAQTWKPIIADFKALATTARSAKSLAELKRSGAAGVGPELGLDFDAEFDRNRAALAAPADDLAEWLTQTLKHHAQISLLGM